VGLPGGSGGEAGGGGKDGGQPQDRLADHAAIADEPGIALAVDLLGRRARRDQTVKAADGAAGNGDEHKRKDGRRAGRMQVDNRRHEPGRQQKETGEDQGQAQVEEK
jgi:hypothetical protein